RPQVTAGWNVAQSACLFDFIPSLDIGAADIHISVYQPRGARTYALLGLVRQAAVHPRRFIPAIAGDSVFLQHVEIVRIALIPRKHNAFDFQIVFAGDCDRAGDVSVEVGFGLTRLQTVVVRKGMGGDLLAPVGGNGGNQASRVVEWIGYLVSSERLPVRIE